MLVRSSRRPRVATLVVALLLVVLAFSLTQHGAATFVAIATTAYA